MSSRLVITNMVLENFKSYGGVKEIGPFHKSFSSIVGPNGSGKSNVIDAMLFVFGKRAKQLRLNRVSELIHKSSDFPDLDFATVTVHFGSIPQDDDSDGLNIISGSEFTISRTAYLNNQSKYAINGKTSSMTEVTNLLKEYEVDLDNNRFLILQGEVEQISMMKPKAQNPHEEGLLEYLEDIIGSNVMVEDIHASALEVEEFNSQRTEKLNRVRMSEREKENLEDAREEAHSYLRSERTIRHRKASVAQLRIHKASSRREQVVEKLQVAEDKITSHSKTMEENDVKLGEIEGEYNEITEEYNEINTNLQSVSDEFAEYEKKDIKFKEELKHLKQKKKRTKTSLGKEERKVEDSSSRKNELSSLLDEMREDVAECEERRDGEEKKLEQLHLQLQEETADLRDDINEIQTSIVPQREEVAAKKGEMETTQTQIDLFTAKINEGQMIVNGIQDEIGNLSQELNQKKASKRSLNSEIKSQEEELDTSQRELSHASEEMSVVQQKIGQLIQQLEETKTSHQASSNKNRAVNRILEESNKRSGELYNIGIVGRLGDLGAIDAKYDTAISMACGMLDHIVVTTTDAGVACMEYLRTNQIGRASFIVLEQLSKMEEKMNAPKTIPDNALRLFDLIEPLVDDVLPALYMGVRDTLVTEDLETALEVAYGSDGSSGRRGGAKWRVVTENGQLIDTSGAMSGGGRKVRKGGMQIQGSVTSNRSRGGRSGQEESKSSRAEVESIKQMESQLREYERRIDPLREAKRELEVRCRQLTNSIKKLNKSFQKLSLEIEEWEERNIQLQDKLEDARSNISVSEEDEREVERLRRLLAAKEREFSSVNDDLLEEETKLKELQDEVVRRGGPKLRNQQQKFDQAVQHLDNATMELSNAEVEISTCESTIKKATKAITKYQNQLEEVDGSISQVTEERKGMEESASKVLDSYEAAKTSVNEKEVQLNEMKKFYEDMRKEMNRLKGIEQDLRMGFDEQDRKLRDIDQILDLHTNELERIIKSQIDDLKEFGLLDESKLEDESSSMVDEEDEERKQKEDGRGDLGNLSLCNQEIRSLTIDELSELDEDDIKLEINMLEGERDRLKSQVNLQALEEYRRKEEEYSERVVELKEITEKRNEKRTAWDLLRRERLDKFLTGFSTITLKLKEMYQMITLGGDAELELVDSLDPFSEGIVFSVRPPRKSWKAISNLSGGEKTLASLALVFALHHFRPTPLYVMDEIDAALDFKNVSIVANYIKERTKNAQFIIISLRNNMFELADRLIGIYKTNDITKTVTINPGAFEKPSSATRNTAALSDRTNMIEEKEEEEV